MRPVDDPLLDLLADSRLGRPQLSDGLWIRLVDVGKALAQRRYACPVDVVIEVGDELCPQNQGRWRLTAATTSAPSGFSGTCERTTAPADLVLPVRALGAAYLGGTRLGPLAAAGLVTEVTPGIPGGAVGRHVVGPGALVPDDLLGQARLTATRAAPPRRGRPGSAAACW